MRRLRPEQRRELTLLGALADPDQQHEETYLNGSRNQRPTLHRILILDSGVDDNQPLL